MRQSTIQDWWLFKWCLWD